MAGAGLFAQPASGWSRWTRLNRSRWTGMAAAVKNPHRHRPHRRKTASRGHHRLRPGQHVGDRWDVDRLRLPVHASLRQSQLQGVNTIRLQGAPTSLPGRCMAVRCSGATSCCCLWKTWAAIQWTPLLAGCGCTDSLQTPRGDDKVFTPRPPDQRDGHRRRPRWGCRWWWSRSGMTQMGLDVAQRGPVRHRAGHQQAVSVFFPSAAPG